MNIGFARPATLPAALIAAIVATLATVASAQDYPRREVRVIVPFPPGGGTDAITRVLTSKLGAQLGQPVIVDNRAGAGSTIGMGAVASSSPDGYTVVVNGDTVALFEYLFANLRFDVQKDFVPVAYYASAPIVLAAHPSFAANTMKELLALARKSPGTVSYATVGVGTPQDIAGLLLAQKAGVRFNDIAYKGGGPALTDVLAGHVNFGLFTISTILPHLQTGKLKALAVVGDRRTPLAPDLPSMGESGLPGVDVSARYVMLAPAGTPPEVLARLYSGIVETVRRPEVTEGFHKLGYEPLLADPKASASMLRAERERLGQVLKAANVKPQ